MESTQQKFKFINKGEAQQYFAGLSKVDMEPYPIVTKLKVWPGIHLGVYKYVPEYLNPVLVDRMKITNVIVDRHGPSASIVSLITGKVYDINCCPTLMSGASFTMSFPQRTYFERTLQQAVGSTQCYASITTCIQVNHKQRPDWKSEDVEFVDVWSNIQRKFTDLGAYSSEVKKLYECAYSYCR